MEWLIAHLTDPATWGIVATLAQVFHIRELSNLKAIVKSANDGLSGGVKDDTYNG